MESQELSKSMAALREALDSGGLSKGLQYLNARVEHRFTAVYRLDADYVMKNVAIFDKEGEVLPESLMAVPLGDSFCQFVLKEGEFRLTDTDTQESRLKGHTYQGVVNSYVGLPLTRAGGDLYGTFCHFDFPARSMKVDEFEYLVQATRVLPHYVRGPSAEITPGIGHI